MNKLAIAAIATAITCTPIAVPIATAKTSDADVIQAQVDAYRARDMDAFIATFAKDARVEANGMVAVGHAQIRAFYALNFKKGAPTVKIVDSGMSGPNVYITASYTFSNGREECCSYSEYTVENGKVTQLVAIG